MPALKREFGRFIADWRDDLPPVWRAVVSNVEPDLAAIGPNLTLEEGEVIFPARKGSARTVARPDAHLFRAFDGLEPRDVKAVILGQDPYPKLSRATGRSFEQGDLQKWSANRQLVAESLRRIIQNLAFHRTEKPAYIDGDAAWSRVVGDIDEGRLGIAQPRALFDAWQDRGVLCLNAALTLSRFEITVQEAHFAVWKPVIRRLLAHLATRRNGSVVFLLWGQVARNTFDELGILDAATDAGTRARVGVAQHRHPGAESGGQPSFFDPPNPFQNANQILDRMGVDAVNW